MDPLDRRIIQILERNARITYREMAKKLGISIPTAQRRVALLEETGRVIGYRTHIHPDALGGATLLIQGQSSTSVDDEAIRGVGSEWSVRRALRGTQNRVYFVIELLRTSELDGLLDKIRTVCLIPNPEVLFRGKSFWIGEDWGFFSSSETRRSRFEELKDVDCRIIWSLHENARKPISEVADEVGLSVKTVRRRLSRMIEDGLIWIEVCDSPSLSEDVWWFLQVRLKAPSSRLGFLERTRAWPGFDQALTFDNVPNLLILDAVTQTVDEGNDILAKVGELDEVESVSADIILQSYYFDFWSDRVIRERARRCEVLGAKA